MGNWVQLQNTYTRVLCTNRKVYRLLYKFWKLLVKQLMHINGYITSGVHNFPPLHSTQFCHSKQKKKHCYLFNERKWAVEIIFHFIYFFIHWSIHLCNVKYCKGPMGWKIRLGFFFFFFLSLFCVVKLNTNSKSVFFFSLDFYKFEYMFYNNILKMNLCRIF